MGVTSEQLLTVKEAAQRLSLHPQTVRDMIYSREIDCVRLGRAVRIPIEQVEKIIRDGYCPKKENRS